MIVAIASKQNRFQLLCPDLPRQEQIFRINPFA